MRFSYVTFLAGLFSTAFCQSNVTSDFDSISQPAKGETIEATSSYTIAWDSGSDYPGKVNLLLEQGDDLDSLKTIGGIAGSLEHDVSTYIWHLSHSIPSGDNYYIKIVSVKDKSIYNYSGKFKINNANESSGGNETTTTTGGGVATATSPTTISTTTSGAGATSSGASSSPPTSTSSGGGSAATAGPAPYALIGAAAMGILAI